MKDFMLYQFRKKFSVVMVCLCLLFPLFPKAVFAATPTADGDLQEYEQKTLFIFPANYNTQINADVLTPERLDFISTQIKRMFVIDFRRITSYGIKVRGTVDQFIHDADAYVHQHAKDITALSLNQDEKFQEALVTADDIKKTVGNAFVLVPYIDSIRKKVVKGKRSNSYIYDMYIHFDIYKTKTREKIATLKINNKKNILGMLASKTGSYYVDKSDLEGLPDHVAADESSFRDSMAGLFVVLKKKLKSMDEFRLKGILTMVSNGTFGFDMGKDTGIKIDHRYKTFVTKANGERKMTGFGKIRMVKQSYSEAQTLIGRAREGDQVEESPKVGINVVAGFGASPLHISLENVDLVSGMDKSLFLGLEYELGPIIGVPELYSTINLRIGLPGMEKPFGEYFDVSQIFVNMGVMKKFHFNRLALKVGGELGIHSATLTNTSFDYLDFETLSGGTFGFSLNSGLEVLITPSVAFYGTLQFDFYPTPSKFTDEDDEKYVINVDHNWNAKGLSLIFGMKVTL